MTELEETNKSRKLANGRDPKKGDSGKPRRANTQLIENIRVEQLIEGIMEVEFLMNGKVFNGTLFSQDIDQMTLRHARAMYDRYETAKEKPKVQKKRRRKHGGRKRLKATNIPPELSSKICRELDELTSQGEQTPPEIIDRKLSAEFVNSPLNSTLKCETNQEAELYGDSPLKNSHLPVLGVNDVHFSDISDNSKESPPSQIPNKNFAIKNLCALDCPSSSPCNGSILEKSHILNDSYIHSGTPNLTQFQGIVQSTQKPQQKMANNYKILKENRELNNLVSGIKNSDIFQVPPNSIPEAMRSQGYLSNTKAIPRGRIPENFTQRLNYPPFNGGVLSANNQRLPNSQADLLKFYQSVMSIMPNQMGQQPINPAVLAAYSPYLFFPRGPQNSGNNPQMNPLVGMSMADAYNMLRHFPPMQGMPRFQQNNPNPRNPGNPNVSGNSHTGRE